MADFDKEKNEKKATADGKQKTADESKKATDYTAAADAWIALAKLWGTHNKRLEAAYLQKAAQDYRNAGENEKSGLKEEEAAKALVAAAGACKKTDPATAKALLDEAAGKFGRAAADYTAAGDAAKAKTATNQQKTAGDDSKALEPYTKE